MKLNEMFLEFNTVYGIQPLERTQSNFASTQFLIRDEVDELWDELYDAEDMGDKADDALDQANLTKELTDILYITMQRMIVFGMDIEDCLKEVHRSNMSKSVSGENVAKEVLIAQQRYPKVLVQDMGGNRFVLRCNDSGKVIKPTSYSAANMEGM